MGKNELNNIPDDVIPDDVKELVSIVVLIPKEDRAILLANANAFKVRSDIEKIRNGKLESITTK